MAINFNNLDQDRAGIIGLDNVVTQPSSAPLQTAFFGFGKSDEEKALEQIQDLRKDQNTRYCPLFKVILKHNY